MAAHVAGVTNAVATCGAAFRLRHVRIIRRLLGDHADPAAGVVLSSGRAHGSEVIFTFDGDSAGQRPRCAHTGRTRTSRREPSWR